jgi:aspartate aminotransferase
MSPLESPVKLSERVLSMKESATLAVTAKAALMKAEGINVVSFGAGEPDFDTPDHIKQAAKDAIDQGQTRYPKPASGLPATREAICAKLLRENQLSYAPNQVMVTAGGKMAVQLACLAILNPGDEVIIPVPYWVSYPEIVRFCGGVPVFVEGNEADQFRVAPAQILEACTEKTKALIFNSPSNPGGFMYEPDHVKDVANAAVSRGLMTLCDDIYDRLVFGGRTHLSIAAVSEDAYQHTITINSASKTYAMTGWRLGYAAGPVDVIKAMAKLQSQGTSGAATMSQVALAAALTGDQSCVERMRGEFEIRGKHIHERLNQLPGVSCNPPMGAFYAFPNVSGTYRALGVKGSVEFSAKLLEEARVAVVPGAAFGADANVRLSFAASMSQINEGVDRLAEWLHRVLQ